METALIQVIYSDEHNVKDELGQCIAKVAEEVKRVLQADSAFDGRYEEVMLIPMPLNYSLGRLAQNRVDIEVVVFAGYHRKGAQDLSEALTEALQPLFTLSLRVRVFLGQSWTPTIKTAQE
jgi:hypothetical protein